MQSVQFELQQPLLVAALLAVMMALAAHTAWSHYQTRKASPFPGPTGIPIFGSLAEMASAKLLHELLGKWRKQYGDLYEIRAGSHRRLFVISSRKLVQQVLEKQSIVTAARPVQHVEAPAQFPRYSLVNWQPVAELAVSSICC